MVCFEKKTPGSGIKNENMLDQHFAEELHKLHSTFIDNIWGADLSDMQLISKLNKRFRFLLCLIDIFNKYAWVIPLEDKKCIVITVFQKVLNKSNHKPNKLWVDKTS